MGHFEYGAKAGVALPVEGLVQANPTHSNFFREFAHSVCTGDVAESRCDERWIVAGFIHACFQIGDRIYLTLEVIRGVVSRKLLTFASLARYFHSASSSITTD